MNIEQSDKTLMEFFVLWEGWECDSEAWVMERLDGTRYLKMTNHGTPYVADVKELQERIDTYESVLSASKDAMQLLINCENTND